jgi:hypothetical protein
MKLKTHFLACKFVIVPVLLLMLCAATGHAQNISNQQSGCLLLDKTGRPQFISYEGLADSNSKVVLRLHNNTNCPIVIETGGAPRQLVKLPNGGFKFEDVTGSQDGTEVALHYLLRSRRKQTIKPGFIWGDSVQVYTVPAGQTILFNVPLSDVRKRLDVAVPFAYAWEGNYIGAGFVGGVQHHVYFLFDDVLKEIPRTSK